MVSHISGNAHYEKTDAGIDYYYAEEVPSIYYSVLLRGGSKPWEKMPFEWTSIESSKKGSAELATKKAVSYGVSVS